MNAICGPMHTSATGAMLYCPKANWHGPSPARSILASYRRNHASLAVSSWDWTWEEDERQFRRALELSPGNATAHQWYAGLLMQTGRIDEALIEARRAVELNPMSPSPNQTLGWVFYMGRQYDR